MTTSTPHKKTLVIGIITGLLLGAAGTYLWSGSAGHDHSGQSDSASKERQPLYWVAPMDANYRRDAPGKSPMGMDLIPVYEETGADKEVGTVSIASHVVNNLGVRTAEVTYRDITQDIHTVGYVRFDESSLVHIHPRVSGWIEDLFVSAEGDPVTAGQALYTLYSPKLVNAQEELLVALKRQNSTLIAAAKARLKALQLDANTIRTIERTQQVQSTLTFYAPQDGVVSDLRVRAGFYVEPGQNLLSIGQLDTVWVEAQVLAEQQALLTDNLPVTITTANVPGQTWQGQVSYVYPTLNAKTRTAKARIRLNNSEQLLKPNMFTQVHITVPEQTPALVVPSEAVIRTGQQDRIVVVMAPGDFKSIAVTTGRMSREYTEILNGLDEGDEVVTSAQFLLDSESSKTSDFKRIEPLPEGASAWTHATVEDVDEEERLVTLDHGPLDTFNMMGMTMDFMVADDIDIDAFVIDAEVHVEIVKHPSGMFQVKTLHVMSDDSMDNEGGQP
jgi:Cu(I)/Ag(I) efflux system membrane fusion protein